MKRSQCLLLVLLFALPATAQDEKEGRWVALFNGRTWATGRNTEAKSGSLKTAKSLEKRSRKLTGYVQGGGQWEQRHFLTFYY
jgi:hypothetical protein